MRADSRKGSAAIEFAFVAPIFFWLLMGTFEGAIMFLSQSVLQNAVTTVGRTLRTGAAGPNMTANDFRKQACAMTSVLFPNCDSDAGLTVNSARYAGGFNAGTVTTVTSGSAGTGSGFTGGACDVMVVRATYPWKVMTPGFTWFLVNSGTDKHLIVTTMAFRNEPYGGAPC